MRKLLREIGKAEQQVRAMDLASMIGSGAFGAPRLTSARAAAAHACQDAGAPGALVASLRAADTAHEAVSAAIIGESAAAAMPPDGAMVGVD